MLYENEYPSVGMLYEKYCKKLEKGYFSAGMLYENDPGGDVLTVAAGS